MKENYIKDIDARTGTTLEERRRIRKAHKAAQRAARLRIKTPAVNEAYRKGHEKTFGKK